jgi:hypothetical protein
MTNDHGKASGTALSPPNIHSLKALTQSKSILKPAIPSIQAIIEKERKMTDTNNTNGKEKTVKRSATKKSPFKKAILFEQIDAALKTNEAKADNNNGTTKEGEPGWTEVSNKKGKDNKKTDEQTGETSPKVKPADVYRIGINIRMLAKKAKPSAYKPQIAVKIMAKALLTAFHSVHDQAWLGPIQHNDGETDGIHTEADVTTDLSKHFQNAKTTNRGHFFARFYLHSNVPLEAYKKDPAFMAWLAAEKISLDINNLSTTTPVFAGFFTEAKPRHDLMDLFQARLRENTPTAMPQYQLTTTTLYAGGARARVYVVATAEEHVEMVQTLFTSVDLEHDNISFYPWNEYLALNKERKLTIIHEQTKFVNTLGSLVITGFTGHNPQMRANSEKTANQKDTSTGANDEEGEREDAQMRDEDEAPTEKETPADTEGNKKGEETDEDVPIGELTMTEYLLLQIKAGDGKAMFEYVHAPVLGKIEVVFQPFRYQEALSFLKVAHRELAREMSLQSVRQALTEPEEAILAASQSAEWKPFKLAGRIAETATTKKHRNPKRQNTHQNRQFRQSPPTAPTKVSPASTTNAWNHYNTPTTMSTLTNNEPNQQTEKAIETLQKQLNDLRTVTTNLQSDNRTIVESIDAVKISHQESTAKLQESANNQHESVIHRMNTANVELETNFSNRIEKVQQQNQNSNEAIMNMFAKMTRDADARAEEQRQREEARAEEQRNREDAKEEQARNETAVYRGEQQQRMDRMEMLATGKIIDQPDGDVVKRPPPRTLRNATNDMTEAVTGQAHKKSKISQRSLNETTLDNLNGADHPMQENSESCSQIGYAADKS